MRFISLFSNKVEKHISLITYVFIFVWTLAALSVSLNRHWQYQTGYFDFGIFDTAIWKVSQLKAPLVYHFYFGNTMKMIFADHFNPSIFLFSPLYWLTDRQEIILVAQTLCVSISAIIAFKLADKFLKNKIAVFSLVFAYLGFVGLQNAVITDFHDTTVAVLPVMLMFWAVSKKKWLLYFLFLVITLGFKESFAGLGIAMGIFLLIKSRANWKFSLITIALSILWGVTAVKYIIPYFSGGVYFYQTAPVSSAGDFIQRFISPSIKLKTYFYSFLSFGFLPLSEISLLPAIFENFFERFFSAVPRGWDLGMHYSATLSPLMFMGALYPLIKIEKAIKHKKVITYYAIFLMLTVFVLHRFVLRGPLGLAYNPAFYAQNAGVKYLDNIIQKTPRDGLVMTQNALATRFTHGQVVLLRLDYQVINPDYVVLNLTPGQEGDGFFPITFEEAIQLKNLLLKDSKYKLIKFADELYLFSKKDVIQSKT